MPTRRVLLAAAAGALLAGCSWAGRDDDVTVALEEMWQQPAPLFTMTAALTPDTLLLAGLDGDATRVVAHDLATGEVVWDVGDGTPVLVPGQGDVEVQTLGKRVRGSLLTRDGFVSGAVLPLAFADDQGAGPSGVVALDAATGEVRWGRTLVAEPSHLRLGTVIMAATETVVLAMTCPIMTVARPGPGEAVLGPGPYTTFALDAATGEVLWSAPDTVPRWADGDVALTFDVAEGGTFARPATVAGRESATGQVRWTRPETVVLRSAAGGHVLLGASGGSKDPHLVELASGSVLPVPDLGRAPRLLPGEPTMLVWGGYDGNDTMITQVVGEAATVEARKPRRFEANAVARGLVWGVQPTLSDPAVVAVDRTGRRRSPRLRSGVVLHVTDDWLIFVEEGFVVPDSYVVRPYRLSDPA